MPAKTFSVDFETSGFRSASRKMDAMGDKADSSGASLKKAGQVGAAAIAGITTAVAGAVAGVAKLTQNTAEYASQVNNAAEQSGLAAENIQEIAFAAEQTSGAEFDTVRDGLKELAIRSEEAASGTGEAKEAFDKLGISQSELQSMSTAETFQRVRQELQGASTSMRTFAAETIFGGEAGQKLVETLGLSNEEMEAMRTQARETGKVLASEQVAALDQTRKAWDRIWSTLQGVGRTIATAMLPVTKRLTPIAQRAATQLQEMVAGIDPSEMGSAMDTAIQWTRRLWSATKSVANSVMNIWDSFVSGLSALWDEWGSFLVEETSNVWQHIVSLFHGAAGVISGVWDTLVGTLTGNWSRAWEGIKQIVTSAALTIAESTVSLVESILNTLSELTSRIPGVGATISSGLESARESVAGFRDRILEANREASGLQTTWEGLAGGDLGGGGAGGLFEVSDDSGGSTSATGAPSTGGGAGGASSGGPIVSRSELMGGSEAPVITPDVEFGENLFSGADVAQVQEALNAGLVQSVSQADSALDSLNSAFQSATSEEQRARIQSLTERVKGLKRQYKQTGQQTARWKEIGRQATAALSKSMNQIANGIGSAVGNLIAGKKAFANFGRTAVRALKQVLAQLVALIPKLAIISAIKGIADISSGGITTIGGALTEAIPFLDVGGRILSDGIAKVHKGETVIPKGYSPQPAQAQGGTLRAEIDMDRLIFKLQQRKAFQGA